MSEYGLASKEGDDAIEVPDLDYRPARLESPAPKIGLIGAGGITEYHLRAYRKLGLEVTAIADPDLAKAEARRDEFFPEAAAHASHEPLLADDAIAIVDVATHPQVRLPIVEAALRAGKHVLSQKPFCLDLDAGAALCDLADASGRHLAVNLNGRWAPHFAWMREAVAAGLIGEVGSVDFLLHWDHLWTAGTPFEEIPHLLLFDFGIHWFDIATVFMGGRRPESVHAKVTRLGYQEVKPPFLASVIADYGDAQVRFNFNAHTLHGQEDRTVVAGSKGTLRAHGPSLNEQHLSLHTADGSCQVPLEGNWFSSGFEGTMAELVAAVQQDRPPLHTARSNLPGLDFCYRAMKSADTGRSQ